MDCTVVTFKDDAVNKIKYLKNPHQHLSELKKMSKNKIKTFFLIHMRFRGVNSEFT